MRFFSTISLFGVFLLNLNCSVFQKIFNDKPNPKITINLSVGKVFSEERALDTGDTLAINSIVNTKENSSADIQLIHGATEIVTNLRENTGFRFFQPRGFPNKIYLRLEKGTMLVKLVRKNPKHTIQIKTPQVVVTVGSKSILEVSVLDEKTSIDSLEGTAKARVALPGNLEYLSMDEFTLSKIDKLIRKKFETQTQTIKPKVVFSLSSSEREKFYRAFKLDKLFENHLLQKLSKGGRLSGFQLRQIAILTEDWLKKN